MDNDLFYNNQKFKDYDNIITVTAIKIFQRDTVDTIVFTLEEDKSYIVEFFLNGTSEVQIVYTNQICLKR